MVVGYPGGATDRSAGMVINIVLVIVLNPHSHFEEPRQTVKKSRCYQKARCTDSTGHVIGISNTDPSLGSIFGGRFSALSSA